MTRPAHETDVKTLIRVFFFSFLVPPPLPFEQQTEQTRGEGRGNEGGRDEETGWGIDPESAPMMQTDVPSNNNESGSSERSWFLPVLVSQLIS